MLRSATAFGTADDQPSNEELHAAWTAALHAEGIPGAKAETMQRLVELRERRSTWFGSQENNLRVALDNYIKGSTAP